MTWTLTYEGYDPQTAGLREALCTLGNGRFATRGAFLDVDADGTHYPGTYLAGGYDRLTTEIAGRSVENEDLVNWPNWLPLRLSIDGEAELAPGRETMIRHTQSLDMKAGVLRRESEIKDAAGRITRLAEERIVSMSAPHLAAVSLSITPVNWSGTLRLRSFIDGSVTNCGVKRYRDLAGKHLAVVDADHTEAHVARLTCRTVQSAIEATIAARTSLFNAHESAPAEPYIDGEMVGTVFSLAAREGATIRAEKTVAFVTVRDSAIASPLLAATEAVTTAPDFGRLLADHERAWATLWADFDISVEDGASQAQLHLRLHLFHLLQTLSPHTAERDVGAPARGWHGEAYRGHIFWDEIFIFRVLNLRAPRLTRGLLRYRYRRLDEARKLAAAHGLKGAMYPWQSASSGREETQTLHLNPNSGRWLPDSTDRQRHVGLAIAHNVWRYYEATNDLDFMIEGGAEMLIEISRFFASLAKHDPETGRYHIRGVMGPDEFHTAYPDRDDETDQGIDDNAYTNVLCSWVLTRTVDAVADLPERRKRQLGVSLGLTREEVNHWLEIGSHLYVPFLSNGLIAQFEGYEALEELDWDAYRAKYGDIHRLDRILEAEGKAVNRYKVSKQADVLMLPFLFSSSSLAEIFEQLGYGFDASAIPRLVEYYDARTSHGSTLSLIVHAWVVARTNRAKSWDLFCDALRSDVDDVQGGTTEEGIHLGAMCGTIDMLQSAYVGCEARSNGFNVDPVLPETLRRVHTNVRYLGHDVEVEATRDTVRIAVGEGSGGRVEVVYRGRVRRVSPGSETTFQLVHPPESRRLISGDAAKTDGA
ncbi:glycoside hydrolase family 65 protein [Acuticoccus sp. M5D2P5]|uniref:glycoside hydrolase family 65 protein n=1 Tax=Acuticoccus kalidii TaxID=2910977 RepID=UPI001F2F4ED2|nr:glycosyl hydrolase family 65 protein [Acuticoccus kalidii]MCF3932178.1 glycoside hydrolase family 65 protein [Acuticoccus kalidii]